MTRAAKSRITLPLALVVGVAGLMIAAQIAGATHPRPKGATPIRVPLVPAYNQCTTPNRTHGPPLAFPSCTPPSPASSFLTVGTPDANGAAANSEGFIKFEVVVGVPGPPSDSNIEVTFRVTDVRCKGGTTACGNANATGGPDYVGELQANMTIRNTDHYNAATAGGGTDPATMTDIPLPVQAYCANTTDTSIGALCQISSSTQAMIPDPCGCEGKRMLVQFGQIRVSDGGPDGIVASNDNTPFLAGGLFIP
jgi:hypothetical protein